MNVFGYPLCQIILNVEQRRKIRSLKEIVLGKCELILKTSGLKKHRIKGFILDIDLVAATCSKFQIAVWNVWCNVLKNQ